MQSAFDYDYAQSEADTDILTVKVSDDELERAASYQGQAVTYYGCTLNFPCEF